MIQITRHIEILLLSNDCVIVPGLGGFVTHEVEARYDETDCMFLPPLRTLGFNSQLQINDSLLAVSYVEAFDISYPEAVRMIEAEVEEIKQTIATDGMFEMNNIGCLYHNKEGGYRFEPCEAGVLTPDQYGLSSFEFNMLPTVSHDIAEAEATPATVFVQKQHQSDSRCATAHSALKPKEPDAENDDKENDYIHINTTWLKNAMLAAAALLIAVMFITPGGTVNGYYANMSTWSSELIHKLLPQDTNCEKITIQPSIRQVVADDTVKAQKQYNAASTAVASQTAYTVADTASEIKNDKQAPGMKMEETLSGKSQEEFYTIVLASSITRRNADDYTNTLKGKGFSDASVYDNGNITRVIYGHFRSEESARDSLRKLRDDSDFFKEAWILMVGRK